jgi:hypothetical protein
MEIDIAIIGLNETLTGLRQLDSLHLEASTSVNRVAQAIRAEMAAYPPVPPGSKYRRTGNLGRSWDVSPQSRSMDGLDQNIFTELDYSPYVEKGPGDGEPDQAWMHEGRWQTDDMVADQSGLTIELAILDELGKIFSSNGM